MPLGCLSDRNSGSCSRFSEILVEVGFLKCTVIRQRLGALKDSGDAVRISFTVTVWWTRCTDFRMRRVDSASHSPVMVQDAAGRDFVSELLPRVCRPLCDLDQLVRFERQIRFEHVWSQARSRCASRRAGSTAAPCWRRQLIRVSLIPRTERLEQFLGGDILRPYAFGFGSEGAVRDRRAGAAGRRGGGYSRSG